LLLVVNQNHDDVGFFRGVGGYTDLKARGFRLCPRFTAVVKPDDYLYAAVFQVQRVSVTLTAVADDCYGFTV
jgi:hypothetical protein